MLLLRRAEEGDCRLVWDWANDPDARAVSFSSVPIPWENHVNWFRSRLADPRCIFYIAIDPEGAPVGQIRYEIDGNEAVVSISIDRQCRGKGFGNAIISLASQKLFEVSDVAVIHAYTKPENTASIRAFIKAGYKDVGTSNVHGHEATHLTLQKVEPA